MTGGISLRTARPADYDAIIAVVDDWWGRPVHRALPRLFLDHFHDTSFIAERSCGGLAGFLIGFGSPAQRDCAYIQFVGVAPEERKSGLARLLYQAFFEMAAKDGRRVVRAVTAPVNSASIAFHAAMGFIVSGPIDGYDGPSSAKVLFERRLDQPDSPSGPGSRPTLCNLSISVQRLAQAGAEFFACPDNTAHIALEQPGARLALPGLHIAEVVADQAASNGYTRVGLLGTRYTMDGPVYPRAFAARRIAAELPAAQDRAILHEIILAELVKGVFTDRARQEYALIIERLAARGRDAVGLVCTEIPLLVPPDASPLPVLDSTRLLARAAFDAATGRRTTPTWRGGPVAG